MSAAWPGIRAFAPKPKIIISVSLILLGIVLASFAAGPDFEPAPQEASLYEYDVKAVFLYHFTQYLQWPGELERGVFTIVVFGQSEIVAPLQEIAKKKTVGPRSIVVRQCSEIGQIGRPRILFISKSAAPRISQVLEKTRGMDILTVGEVEGLGFRGVAVNFVMREGTIKFEMSEKALKDARIRISSQLLKLAILVDEEEARGER